ncbi:GNAT family N-acetyltransferase [Zobellia galactanivorans]|uniref:GNAT family N-acetyltransferase n=1 Tax=Zobellia galactanivorans (strain DSM 12802 / CCUG 47099 / CIP 106680 / NCIMB 13871 / Dsij) TaxID=63186 RepID=UPI00031F814E|nr:GNAT family N-acetyltransferase [Zobellia galactanivorans]
MIRYGTASTDDELKQILALQERNLASKVSSPEKEKEGFVTVAHTFDTLKAMNNTCPHIIAKLEHAVIGYALCMHPRFSDAIEVLKPMFDEIEGILPPEENYIVMGQICIDKDFRRQGVFRKLYETMQAKTKKDFSSIITEIDAVNTRSLQAHFAVGFKELHSYTSGAREWKIVRFRYL